MIRAPDVDAGVKMALLEFVSVVGDVRGKIGGIAVGADKHLVLLPAEVGRLVPERAVLFVCQTFFGQDVDDLLHLAVLVQRAFQEPCVVGDAVLGDVGFHFGDVFGKGIVHQRPAAFFLGLFKITVAVDVGEFLRQLGNVRAVVGILGQLHRVLAFEELLVAHVKREGKFLDLVARVVDVELALHIIAGVFQHRRQTVAQRAAA